MPRVASGPGFWTEWLSEVIFAFSTRPYLWPVGVFEADAETSDADLGVAVLWKGLEVTAIDGTTMELEREACLKEEFGSSAEAAGRCCG